MSNVPPPKSKTAIFLSLLLFEAVGKRCSCRLRDDPFDIEACNSSCIFCRLALRVVKVSRNGDDRFGDLFSEIGFGCLFHLDQDLRADLFRSEHFAFDFKDGIAIVRF